MSLPTTVPDPALPAPIAARRVPDRLVGAAALALLVGGPASLALHALWRIGHGPTVVNEHGVVLGLTNDQWRHLGPLWAVPVALGVVVAMSLHSGRSGRAAAWLSSAGLVGGAAAAWIWPLYSVSALVLGAGLLCLSLTVWRGRVLQRWLAVPPAIAVTALLPFALWPDVMYAVETTIATVNLDLTDLPVVAQAVTWTALGAALLQCRERPHA
jgi:hypothetical protein